MCKRDTKKVTPVQQGCKKSNISLSHFFFVFDHSKSCKVMLLNLWCMYMSVTQCLAHHTILLINTSLYLYLYLYLYQPSFVNFGERVWLFKPISCVCDTLSYLASLCYLYRHERLSLSHPYQKKWIFHFVGLFLLSCLETNSSSSWASSRMCTMAGELLHYQETQLNLCCKIHNISTIRSS